MVLTTKAPREAGGGADRDHRDRLELGKSVVFRMTGAAPIKTKTLLLKDPNRYVVDLQGNWASSSRACPRISGFRASVWDTMKRAPALYLN